MSNRNQQELAARVDAASAKARELKAELEAAQRRIAELISEKEANGAVSMTRPPVPGRKRKRARRYTRGGVILTAGVAASFVALLAWGAMTLIQFATSEPIPPLAASEETSAGPSQADLEQPPAGSAPSPADPATGGLDPNRAAAPAQVDDLAAAQREIARLSAEVEASDIMIARLRDELSQAGRAAEAPREPGSSDGEPGTASRGPEPGLAAAVTRARVVELQRELEAARQQIEALTAAVARAEAEAAKHRSELVARQQLPAAPPPAAPSDQGAGAQETGTAAPQAAEEIAAIPVVEEVLTAAESSSEPPAPEVSAARDTVSPDDLLLRPDRHFGRQVVVTGSVVWLLRRYWLQSDDGHKNLLIDVASLPPDARDALEDAVVKIDYLAQAEARITGTLEREGSEAYRLAATDLVLVE